jgi:acyl-CoA-binding protein
MQIYGLYKVIVNGSEPSSSRPSIFDQVGRAKWDAWLGAGKTWVGAGGDTMKEAAQLRYLEIARAVGWKEGEPEGERAEDDVDLDRLDDDEMPSHSLSSSSGMGARVSTMTPMRVEVVRVGCGSLHDSAATGDVAGLERYLASDASCGVDDRDSDARLKRMSRSPHLILLQGYTALHLASDRGHLEVIKFLVTTGADLELKVSFLP